MRDRFSRITISVLVVLLAFMVAQPYLNTLFFAATAPRAVEARGDLAASEKATIALFKHVAPSVVQVVAVPAGAINEDGTATAADTGSGFIWDAAGHVVTNNHVVRDATEIAVRLSTGEAVPAEIVGRAPNYDLAVLRLKGGFTLPPPIPVGRSADLEVGQAAFAIGNPFGLDQSLSTGIISALKRRLPTSEQREIADVIQTDAAINPGNSGGPLLDSSGRLIGVTTAIFSPSGTNAGIGFAIPVDVINRIVPQLIKNGRVPTPGIGILAADEALAARLGIQGVVVAATIPGSPAEKSGLRGIDTENRMLGDIIVEANGQPVRRLADLSEQLEKIGVNHSINLTIRRGDHMENREIMIADLDAR